MKRMIIASMLTMLSLTSCAASDITLPQPQKKGGMPCPAEGAIHVNAVRLNIQRFNRFFKKNRNMSGIVH